jgi:multiple sugar transport system substrate-binding protein
MIELRGVSWDHPRGHDPMVATAADYMRDHPGVRIVWDTRSLKDFGDYPVEDLAERYDLILVDHPHAGTAARTGCLLAADDYLDAAFLADQAVNSVGPSHASYQFAGKQWALANDAAGHVGVYRPDLLETPPATWEEVFALAESRRGKAGVVAMPMKPTDAICSFLSLCANAGEPPFSGGAPVVSRAAGRHALETQRRIAALGHPEMLDWNPIATLDRMSTTDEVAYVPLLFGYSNYSRPGFRERLLAYTDIPLAPDGQPRGGILGGVGIAVSARTRSPETAFDYARYVTSGEIQRTTYFAAGGQPGHRSAWLDPAVNAASNDYFAHTLRTLDLAYLRPRDPGYETFQLRAGDLIHEFLVTGGDIEQTLDHLDLESARIIRD